MMENKKYGPGEHEWIPHFSGNPEMVLCDRCGESCREEDEGSPHCPGGKIIRKFRHVWSNEDNKGMPYCLKCGIQLFGSGWGSKICEGKKLSVMRSSWIPQTFDRPEIVCLIGSTMFKKEFEEAAKKLTLEGKIVLSVGMFGHQEGLDMNGPIKQMLDELHLRKIDLADSVFVINVSGYVGNSTSRELTYARANNKNIYSLEPLE